MLYDRIKEVCKERGVSVTEVEKQAGLSNGLISKWNDSAPSAQNLRAVAKVLRKPMEYFLKEEINA